MSGSFDVPRSRTDGDLSQLVNLADTVSPKRDPALVGDVLRRFCYAEKLRGAIRAGSLKL